jgi:hypothetical protein
MVNRDNGTIVSKKRGGLICRFDNKRVWEIVTNGNFEAVAYQITMELFLLSQGMFCDLFHLQND